MHQQKNTKMRIKILTAILAVVSLIAGCKNRYDLEVDSEDVNGYVSAYIILNANFKGFITYIQENNDVDTSKLENYNDIKYVLNSNGFIDMDYFMQVHETLHPIVEIISQHPNEERFPSLSNTDLSIIEAGEKQFREYLESNTLSPQDKEFYEAQMSQIKSTKIDLVHKQDKNIKWVALIRNEIDSHTSSLLSDNDIMQLTILERETSQP